MGEYYAVERSSEYLAHYGVKGMKWGVRKAIERGDRAALSKQYQKAVKKLGKLSMNANHGFQKKRYAQAKANMIAGAGMSATGSAVLTAAANPHADLKRRALYSLGAGAAGAVAGALANSQGFGARRYVSDRGHAKAIVKRDQWKRDLEDTFKGTPYGGRKMHKFHNEITRMSDVKDIKGYVQGQYRKSLAEYKRNQRGNSYVVADLRSKKRRQAAGASGPRIRTVHGYSPQGKKLSNADREALLAIANGKVKPTKRRRY